MEVNKKTTAVLRKKRPYRRNVDYYSPKRDRFLANITVNEDGCWIWTGIRSASGYGMLHSKDDTGKIYIDSAHRLSYQEFKGEIPKGMVVCHKCDVRACTNPEHLFLGSTSDNIQDCSNKGRHFNGSKTHCKNGHPFSGDNLYVTLDGKRRFCKTCRDANLKDHYERTYIRRDNPHTHCKNGHSLSGDNLYISPSGKNKTCRICRDSRMVEWRAKNKIKKEKGSANQ